MDKVLITLYVPAIGAQYELWISSKANIQSIKELMVRGIKEMTYGEFVPKSPTNLYNKKTGLVYDANETVKNSNIVSGTELILV